MLVACSIAPCPNGTSTNPTDNTANNMTKSAGGGSPGNAGLVALKANLQGL